MTDLRIRLLRDERGMALVIALLVLLTMSLLATVLMVSINVESKITSHGLRETDALNVAEAGVGEAQGRIAAGDIALGGNPLAVAQIFNTVAGSVPVLGTDSVGLATAQPTGEWLPYSTATRGPDVLTVEYKTDNARTFVYRYDATMSPPVQKLSGSPIYVITSTGVVGGDLRRVRAEVYAKRIPAAVYAAMMANVGVELKGTIDVCGLNHTSSMPTGAEDDPMYHTGSGDLPGTWSSGEVDIKSGAAYSDGSPTGIVENQVGPYTGPNGFYAGPWDVFGMTQAEFFAWIGSPVAPPQPPLGLVYIDGDAAYHGGDGEGLLYVTGDMTINGTFTYRGLIYVEGDLHLNGDTWILGGLIVKGTTTVKLANGNAAVLYSADAIAEAIARATGSFTRLSWRELY
jgi:Tfp pilus assembly protein PilX